MSSAVALAPLVSLQFSLADSPRTQIVEWFDDLSAKARGLCAQWDRTGAITLIATDAVWNAIPGNITNAAQVLAGTHAPQYRTEMTAFRIAGTIHLVFCWSVCAVKHT